MDRTHAPLAPSSASQWVVCPGSVPMQALFPETEGEEAREGDACHWLAAEALHGRVGTRPVGMTAANGVIITEEHYEAAVVYVKTVRGFAPGPCALYIEHPITIPRVHEQCYGTPDAFFYDAGTATLHLPDLKFGFGIVDVFENWQLICYAVGVLDFLQLDDQKTRVKFYIVQPRGFHREGPVRTWEVLASDLRPYANKLAHAAQAAMLTPQCVSSVQCRYCSARHACPSAQQAAMYSVDYVGQPTPEALDAVALAIELRTLRRASEAINYRLTGLEAQAEAMINAGQLVPGFTLQHGTGRATWNKPAAEVFALGDLLGVKLQKDPEPVSPAEARKRGLDETLLNAYTFKPSTGVKLIPNDKTVASRVFGTKGVTPL